jgi:hypothetical protein
LSGSSVQTFRDHLTVPSSRAKKCMRTDFHRHVDEICPVPGYYAASCGNYIPTFRDNLSVPSSRVKKSSWTSLTP